MRRFAALIGLLLVAAVACPAAAQTVCAFALGNPLACAYTVSPGNVNIGFNGINNSGYAVQLAGALSTSAVGGGEYLFTSPTLTFTGAGSLSGNGEVLTPTLSSTTGNMFQFGAYYARPIIQTGYTGSISYGNDYYGDTPTLNGAAPFGTWTSFQSGVLTNGNGITSGSAQNYGFYADTPTAAAGTGGTVLNVGGSFSLGSGSSAGTTNRGVWIQGNGGAASTNWALSSDSTALSYMVGGINFGAAAAPSSGSNWQFTGPTNNTITTLSLGKTSPGSGANQLTSQLAFKNFSTNDNIATIEVDTLGIGDYNLSIFTNGHEAVHYDDTGVPFFPQLSNVTSAQTGTVCWSNNNTPPVGKLTYDNTNTCLVSSLRFKRIKVARGRMADHLEIDPATVHLTMKDRLWFAKAIVATQSAAIVAASVPYLDPDAAKATDDGISP